jgi:dTDP-4-dehydrorhamnose 3,5-epimerase
MIVNKSPLEGVLVIQPKLHLDARGFFLESFENDRYVAHGIQERFIQENHSRSVKHVLRGLHFTRKKPQAQLLTVMRGTIFDVVVDIRRESVSFGKWYGIELSDNGNRQIFMPHGFAHGFCVLSDYADLHYKVSQKYDPDDDGGLVWDDKDVNIQWPIENPIISDKDLLLPSLQQIYAHK